MNINIFDIDEYNIYIYKYKYINILLYVLHTNKSNKD